MCTEYACGLCVGCWGLRDGRTRPPNLEAYSALCGRKTSQRIMVLPWKEVGGALKPKRGARHVWSFQKEVSHLSSPDEQTESHTCRLFHPHRPWRHVLRMGRTLQTHGVSSAPPLTPGQARLGSYKAPWMPPEKEANARKQRASHSGDQTSDYSLLFSQGFGIFRHCLNLFRWHFYELFFFFPRVFCTHFILIKCIFFGVPGKNMLQNS